VIGTSKGIILVFDYQQSLKTIIGTGTHGLSNAAHKRWSDVLMICSC
jgi:hypothetical protein